MTSRVAICPTLPPSFRPLSGTSTGATTHKVIGFLLKLSPEPPKLALCSDFYIH